MEKAKKKKILMFCTNFKSSSGDIMGRSMANALSKHHNVNYVENIRKLPWHLHLLVSIPVYTIKSLFQKSDITIALKPFPASCLAALIQKAKGASIILDIDDVDYGFSKSGFKKFLSGIMEYAQSLFISRFDLIMVHNNGLIEKIKHDFKIKEERLCLRGQGVDLDIFKPKETTKKNAKKTLIFLGFLNASSYLEDTLKALKIASLKKKNIKFVVIGNGYKEEYYKSMAKKLNIDTEFLGYISDQDVISEHINASDACIVYYPDNLSNRYRASMKLREYLAIGKPTVCNDLGDLKNFAEYTYCAKTGDLEDLSEKIINALFDPDKREERGRDYVRKNLSWDFVMDKVLRMVENA